MITLALIGARGRMGRLTRDLIDSTEDMRLSLELGSDADLARSLAECPVDVGIDFTVAGLGAAHGRLLLEAGVRPLIGTSGVTPEQDLELDALARERALAGLVVPNFSLGVWLQQELARRAARFLPSVEIIEEHHASKVDAPSGTALDTAYQLAGERGLEPSAIPIHSLRIRGLYSNQSVVLGGEGEVLRIRHEVYGHAAFGPGILAGIRYLMGAEPGVRRGIGHAFEAQAGGAPTTEAST